MSLDDLGRHHAGPDAEVRRLLSAAAPDVTAPVAVDGDLERGRAALGRRRSLLATLAVGAGTALVAAAAVLVPQGLTGVIGSGGQPASGTTSAPAEQRSRGTQAPEAQVVPVGGRVPLVAGPQQQDEDLVATLVPQGWEITAAGPAALTLADPATDEQVRVVPAEREHDPPVLEGVGDFERVEGSWASYYLLDTSGGTARPTMVLQLTNGSWATVSASPALGWGMPELTTFAAGLRAPFTCADPCEVPLAP